MTEEKEFKFLVPAIPSAKSPVSTKPSYFWDFESEFEMEWDDNSEHDYNQVFFYEFGLDPDEQEIDDYFTRNGILPPSECKMEDDELFENISSDEDMDTFEESFYEEIVSSDDFSDQENETIDEIKNDKLLF